MFLKLTSNGAEFPLGYAPVTLDYFVSFDMVTDFAILTMTMTADINQLGQAAAIELEIEPDDGDITKFSGIIYDIEYVEHNTYKIYIVSKYMKGLQSTLPLYGKGKAIGILESFYRKAGVPKSDVTASKSTFGNLLFPRTTTVEEAIQYVLARTVVASKKGGTETHCLSALVNDTVLIRGVYDKNSENIEDQYLTFDNVIDKRKAIDINGGLKVGILDDTKGDAEQHRRFPGDATVEKKRFFSTSDKESNANRANVRQSRVYFNNYIVEATLPYWQIHLGRNIQISKDYPVNLQEGKIQVITGLYLMTSQILMMNFIEQSQVSMGRMKLVEELK